MQTLTVADVGERQLIARITARLVTPAWVVVGPGDDAAVIKPARGALEVLTTDALVEDVHFDRRFVAADAIGHRALAVNLSDLAAMGAEPRAALLSLALPPALEIEEIDRLIDGLLGLAAAQRVAVIGGNITRSPGPLVVDVTAIGAVRRRQILRRSGARPGDEVYVTGTLGDAAAGLRSLQASLHRAANARSTGTMSRCEARYLRPDPRVRAGMMLARNRAASSCMDLSDGLADAARQVATASGVGITIDAQAIPIADDAREWFARHGETPIEAALAGGDDYELLFTVRRAHRGRLRAVRRVIGDLPITRIGIVTKEREVVLRDEHRARMMPSGYEHFQ